MIFTHLLHGWAHAIMQNRRRGSAAGRPPGSLGVCAVAASLTCGRAPLPGLLFALPGAERDHSSGLGEDNMSVWFRYIMTRCPLWPCSVMHSAREEVHTIRGCIAGTNYGRMAHFLPFTAARVGSEFKTRRMAHSLVGMIS